MWHRDDTNIKRNPNKEGKPFNGSQTKTTNSKRKSSENKAGLKSPRNKYATCQTAENAKLNETS